MILRTREINPAAKATFGVGFQPPAGEPGIRTASTVLPRLSGRRVVGYRDDLRYLWTMPEQPYPDRAQGEYGMRTLVIVILLSAAAWGQTNLTEAARCDGLTTEVANLRMAEIAPVVEPVTPIEAPVPPKASHPDVRRWFLLSAASHGAAAFDAWTTRESVSDGNAELNPVLKPFAGSGALYPVMQIGPAVGDYVGWRMMRSNRPLVRKLWWVPQLASAAISFACGAKNASSF